MLPWYTFNLRPLKRSKEEYALYMLGWSLLLAIKGVQEALINLPFTIYAPRLSGLK
jgi:hypothetical protein